MTASEKARKDAEMEAKGYVKDYAFDNGKLVEIWIGPPNRPLPTPKVYDKNGRLVRPDIIVK